MSKPVVKRTGKDRLRYSMSFEVLLMAFLIPAGMVFFDRGFADIGLLGIVLSVKAMLVSLAYNWIYDHFDARSGRVASDRSHIGRVGHAVGFELTLVTTSLPIYMWWLDLTVIAAITTDLIVTGFIVIYTYGFTLGYDRLFPVATLGAPKPRVSAFRRWE